MMSPWFTKSGTLTLAPVSTRAGLKDAETVSPRMPGSVSVTSSSTFTMLTSLPSISKVEPTRKSLVDSIQVLHRQDVAAAAEPADEAQGGRRGDALLPEVLTAGEEVREVHLDDGHVERAEAVVEGDRVMRQCGRVDDHADRVRALFVEAVDQLALVVGLEEADGPAVLLGLGVDHGLDVGQRLAAVDLRLAAAEDVQVGAVGDHEAMLGGHVQLESISVTAWRTRSSGTSWPASARPISRSRTHRRRPPRDFLSPPVASSTCSGVSFGSGPGRPWAARSSSWASTSDCSQRPSAAEMRAAARMPAATARPWWSA